MRRKTNRSVIWSLLGGALLAGCVSQQASLQPPNPIGETSSETDNAIAVCSAGLSTELGARLDTIVDRNGITLSQEQRSALRGAIFQDPSLGDRAKVEIFDRYLSCVDRIRRENQLPRNAKDVVQRDLVAVTWGSAGIFRRSNSLASINWVGQFSYAYSNTSSVPVSCRSTVRGINFNEQIGRIASVGETVTANFDIAPNDTYYFDGEVGAPGYTDGPFVVRTDERFSCSYR